MRLDTVISSPNVTASAREYFRKETKSVLAFYEKCDVIIKIAHCDINSESYKLFLIFDSLIINMCKDIQFNVNTNAFVNPGAEVNNTWGEVTILNIKDTITGTQAGEPVGIPKCLTQKGYNNTIPLLISANGKAEYKFGFGIWSKYNQDKEPFFTSVDRFTDSYNLSIANGSENEFAFEFNVTLRSKSELFENQARILQPPAKLEPGNTIQVMKGNNLRPGDIIDIYFGAPIYPNNNAKGGKENEQNSV